MIEILGAALNPQADRNRIGQVSGDIRVNRLVPAVQHRVKDTIDIMPHIQIVDVRNIRNQRNDVRQCL